MDLGRERDLAHLKQRFNDGLLPYPIRLRAERTYYRIRKQLADRHLQSLRNQLIKAHINNDVKAAENIGEIIYEYEYRRFGIPEYA